MRMPSAPKTRELLLDRCRSKYSWAAGATRGTPSAVEWHRRDLEVAFAEINGLMAGLRYQDTVESCSAQYPTEITLGEDLLCPTGGTANTGGSTPDAEYQPMASQWAAIRSLRDETAFHHQRFQQLCRDLGDHTISKLLEIYPDAQSILNKGAQLVKDVLEGFRPRELSLVFAFTSFAYAISQLLYKKGRIDRSEILADLNAWRSLIPDAGERQAFDLIAKTLWPEAKDHLHFIPVPAVPRDAALYNSDLLWSSVNQADSAIPDCLGFSAHGEPSGDRSTGLYPTDPFDLGSAFSYPGLENGIDADFVGNGSHLMNLSNETFGYAALGSFSQAPLLPEPPDWVQPNSVDGPPNQPSRGKAADVPGGTEQLGPVKPVGPKEVRLDDTGMFLVVIVFLQDIAELVYILSGRSLSSRRHKLYKAEEREQDVFYQSAREAFFTPRHNAYNAPDPKPPAFFALLSVAERFTEDGLLRSIAEIRHYLASVAAAAFPPGHVFEQFLSFVLHGSSGFSPTPPAGLDGRKGGRLPGEDCSSPELPMSPKEQRRTYKCEYEGCDASYSNRSALRKHKMQLHLRAALIKCGECDYGNARRDRVRSHFLRKHPGIALPERLLERRRAASNKASPGSQE